MQRAVLVEVVAVEVRRGQSELRARFCLGGRTAVTLVRSGGIFAFRDELVQVKESAA